MCFVAHLITRLTIDNPLQLGPFTLTERLGHGGMGVVWRAQRRTGEEVAVKVLQPRVGSSSLEKRQLLREIRTASALNHAHITRVFDYGIVPAVLDGVEGLVEGSPWYAMALIEGGDLWNRAASFDWTDVRAVLLDVLGALGHAHARRIVHRDVKPENILIAPGRRVHAYLTDFGVAHETSFDAMQSATNIAIGGTPSYMAPEQFAGRWRWYGPWTDLYGVGCVAWHILTGAPLFTGISALNLAMQHTYEPPPRFQPRIAVPEGVEDWLLRCLAKTPLHRFIDAATAARALRAIVSDDMLDPTGRTIEPPDDDTPTMVWGSSPTELLPSGVVEALTRQDRTADGSDRAVVPGPPVPRFDQLSHDIPTSGDAALDLMAVRQHPVVGRLAERRSLWRLLRKATQERSVQLAIVEGGTGSGKTTLARWLCQRAHEAIGAQYIEIASTPSESARDGFALAVGTLTKTANEPAERVAEDVTRLLQWAGGGEIVEQRAALLAEIISGDPLPGRPRESMTQQHRHNVLMGFLTDLAHAWQRPLLIVIDDVQWDNHNSRLARQLTQHAGLSGVPVVVIVTTTPVDEEAPSLHQALVRELVRQSEAAIELSPIADGDHREIIRSRVPLAPRLVEQLVSSSRQPLETIKLIDDWAFRGSFVATDQGLDLPAEEVASLGTDMRDLWRRSLDFVVERASEQSHHVESWIELGAAIGDPITEDLWHEAGRLMGLAEPTPLDTMIRAGLAASSSRGLWSFVDPIIPTVVHDRAAPAAMRRAHSAVAEVLEKRRKDDVRHLRLVAHHLERAERLDEALETLICGARRTVLHGHAAIPNLGHDIDRLCRSLGLPDDDPRTIYVRITELAQTIHQLEFDELREEIEATVETARRTGWRQALMDILLLQLKFLALCRRTTELLSLVPEALELTRDEPEAHAMVMTAEVMATLLQGDLVRATELQVQVRKYASDQVPAQLPLIDTIGSKIANVAGRPQEGLVFLDRAIEGFQNSGSVPRWADALNSRGESYRLLGNFDAAEADYQAAVSLWDACGVLEAGVGRFNLAMVRLQRGDIEAAREGFASLSDYYRRTNRLDDLATGFLGLAACATGDPAQVAAYLDELDSLERPLLPDVDAIIMLDIIEERLIERPAALQRRLAELRRQASVGPADA